MARYVVPLVVVLVMVGGYVVGQQPTNTLTDLPGDANLDGKVDLADIGILKPALSGARPTSEVGRYLPADGGKMLDTTNGTLYAIEGNAARWTVVATLPEVALQTVEVGEKGVREFMLDRRRGIIWARAMLEQETNPRRRETLERYHNTLIDVIKDLEQPLDGQKAD